MAAFYALLLRFFTAVPIIDDFWQILGYSLDFQHAPTAGAKLGLLLNTQFGPYKLIFEEVVIDAQLLMTGKLHFPAMVLVANLALLGVFFFLCRNMVSTGKYRVLQWLPVSLLLFNLNYAENVDWAGCALAQLAVLLFACAALHFLVKRAGGVGGAALASLFALLASLSFANGNLLWPVGLLFLALEWRQPGWSFAKLATWLAGCALSLAVYLVHNAGSAIPARAPLWKQLAFAVLFCGGGLENMHHRPVPYLSVVLGVGVLATVAHAVKTRYDRRNPFFFYLMMWSLITALAVAHGRAGMGLQMSLSARYKLYCDLLLIFCFVYGLDRVSARLAARRDRGAEASLSRYLAFCTACALLFCIGGDLAGAKFLLTRKQRAETAMRAYLLAPETASPMFLVEDVLSPDEIKQEDLARQTMNTARREGIYSPPPADHLGLF